MDLYATKGAINARLAPLVDRLVSAGISAASLTLAALPVAALAGGLILLSPANACLLPLVALLAAANCCSTCSTARSPGGPAAPTRAASSTTSHFDHPALRIALGPRYRDHLAIASASDYFWRSRKRAFFAGWLGGFPFSRDPRGGAESLHAVEAFLAGGWSVLIYPEGTRSRTGALGTFHAGPALVATRTGCDVLPVRIVGTRSVLPVGATWPHRAQVQVRFGAPLRAQPGEDPRAFTTRLESAIAALA